MNISYKEAQFELFPNAVSTPDETRRPHFMAARFNLSIENLVIFSIVSIMVTVFTFSLGVERGKRIALREGNGPALDAPVPEAPVSAAGPVDPAEAVAAVKSPAKGSALLASLKTVNPAVSAANVPAAAFQPQDVVKKTSGGFTVQVASYKSKKSAQKEVQALQKKGFKAYALPKGEHIVLCVGNFQKREEASMYGKKLKNNYQDLVVRRL